jgi:hypothetical protein
MESIAGYFQHTANSINSMFTNWLLVLGRKEGKQLLVGELHYAGPFENVRMTSFLTKLITYM